MVKTAGHMALMLLLRNRANHGGLPEPGLLWLLGSGPPPAYSHLPESALVKGNSWTKEQFSLGRGEAVTLSRMGSAYYTAI